MITFVVHLIKRSPHDYWDVISITPATNQVVYNSIDLDHTTMRCKYLQCTFINTFLYYLVPFLVKKIIMNWKNKHIFCTSLIFFGSDFTFFSFSLIMPKADMVQKSGFKFNITEPFVDIRYTAATASVTNCISFINIIIFIVISKIMF